MFAFLVAYLLNPRFKILRSIKIAELCYQNPEEPRKNDNYQRKDPNETL